MVPIKDGSAPPRAVMQFIIMNWIPSTDWQVYGITSIRLSKIFTEKLFHKSQFITQNKLNVLFCGSISYFYYQIFDSGPAILFLTQGSPSRENANTILPVLSKLNAEKNNKVLILTYGLDNKGRLTEYNLNTP